MSHLILSPSHQYHTGDWNEEIPMWSPILAAAYTFTSKLDALDTMREHNAADIAAKRTPCFAGCRVVELDAEKIRLVTKELRKAGYKASFNESCTMIWIDFDDRKISIEKAIAQYPREIYGMPVRLRAQGKPIAWDHKRKL